MLRISSPKALKAALPYVADAGTVAFVAAAGFALVVAAVEFFRPGLVASAVAPQTLVVMMLATGAAALADVSPRPRSRRQKAAFAAAGIAGTAFAFWASWYYFSPVPDARPWLASSIAAVIGLLFAGASAPPPEDV
ncbi:MAG: hypothetical protein RL272_964 [Candidatus Parcubacteria bacterium]|jgi:hypothetical protein